MNSVTKWFAALVVHLRKKAANWQKHLDVAEDAWRKRQNFAGDLRDLENRLDALQEIGLCYSPTALVQFDTMRGHLSNPAYFDVEAASALDNFLEMLPTHTHGEADDFFPITDYQDTLTPEEIQACAEQAECISAARQRLYKLVGELGFILDFDNDLKDSRVKHSQSRGRAL